MADYQSPNYKWHTPYRTAKRRTQERIKYPYGRNATEKGHQPPNKTKKHKQDKEHKQENASITRARKQNTRKHIATRTGWIRSHLRRWHSAPNRKCKPGTIRGKLENFAYVAQARNLRIRWESSTPKRQNRKRDRHDLLAIRPNTATKHAKILGTEIPMAGIQSNAVNRRISKSRKHGGGLKSNFNKQDHNQMNQDPNVERAGKISRDICTTQGLQKRQRKLNQFANKCHWPIANTTALMI